MAGFDNQDSQDCMGQGGIVWRWPELYGGKLEFSDCGRNSIGARWNCVTLAEIVWGQGEIV